MEGDFARGVGVGQKEGKRREMCGTIASTGTNDGWMVEKGVGSSKDDTDTDSERTNQVQTLVIGFA